MTRLRKYALAEEFEREGVEYCLERGLDAWRVSKAIGIGFAIAPDTSISREVHPTSMDEGA